MWATPMGEPGGLRGGTLFSGIGAPEVAMGWVDWRWCAEVDPFASAVLKHHYPHTPNLGDVNEIDADTVEPVDIVVFGSPCQSWSVAGKRLGLDDPRGNLALVALRLISRIRPKWVVFENVPGLLSSDGGRDFGAFLGLLGECGYGFAYRILDAQHAGVPQRRRRVFVVGYLGDWRPPAAVLFEQESLRWNTPPRREAGENAPTLPSRSTAGGGLGTDFDCDGGLIAGCLLERDYKGSDSDTKPGHLIVAKTLRANGFDAARSGEAMTPSPDAEGQRIAPTIEAGANRTGGTFVAVNISNETHTLDSVTGTLAAERGSCQNNYVGVIAHTLRADGFDAGEDGTGRRTPLVATLAFDPRQIHHPANHSNPKPGDPCHPLRGVANAEPAILTLAIRGRGDSHDLEYRDDGTANAILTPNGGRAGIGVGAVAYDRYNNTTGDVVPTLQASTGGHSRAHARQGMSVRRLTPVECERLQGFPDDFTLIQYRGKPAADGPRYRALGNSMAVPVIAWIGRRIRDVEDALQRQGRAA